MIERAQKNLGRATVKRRRKEIAQCLAEFGFPRGPRRLSAGANGDDSHFCRLGAALVTLGPVFSSFGIYLSSRVDMLSPKHCLELATIPDQAEPTPIDAIQRLILEELGCSLTEAYREFTEQPFESRLFYQSHRAWLSNGMAVTVKILHPEMEKQLLRDLELLVLLKAAFSGENWADFPIERVIADFRCVLREQIDLAHEADAMDALARDAKTVDVLTVAEIHPRLCSSKILTLEFLSGSSLADLISDSGKGEFCQSATASLSGIDLIDLARRLCRVWLRQALLGNTFPVEPRAENILVLSEKRIAFTAGSFAGFSPEAKANMWNYLLAVASEDPDMACSCLLREMDEDQRKISQDELAHRFRQVAPFRDGGWNNGRGDSLAEQLFVQWRFARESGCHSTFKLISFYRGLFSIAAAAEQLSPGHNALLRGLEEVRLVEMMGKFQQMMELRPLANDLGKYASMMMELPRQLDEALTLATEGNTQLKLRLVEAAGYRKQKNALAIGITLLIVLVAAALLSHHLAVRGGAGSWAERIGATLCMLIGAMLLRVVIRSR